MGDADARGGKCIQIIVCDVHSMYRQQGRVEQPQICENLDGALEFVSFLLSEDAQRYFVDEVFEFPVIENVESRSLFGIDALMEVAPDIELNDLDDLNATLDLLREVGLL